jgi:hypothetical protein
VLAKASNNLNDRSSLVGLSWVELSGVECCGSVVTSRCCEVLVAEAMDSSGTQRKRNVRCWKPLPRNGNKHVTVDTSVCVSVSLCLCVCVCM